MAAEPKTEADLIRALAEDLALEILASYTPDDFADADFTSLGEAAAGADRQGSESGRDIMLRRPQAAGQQPTAGLHPMPDVMCCPTSPVTPNGVLRP
jgi:hypothetical protein